MAGRPAPHRCTIASGKPVAPGSLTKLDLKHVHRFKDRHGKVRHYLRLPGCPSVSLPGAVGSAEFMQAYQQGLRTARPAQQAPRTVAGSLDAVIVSFYASNHWTALRDTTQAHYRRAIEEFRSTHGALPVRLLDETGVRKMLEKKAGRPAARNRRLRLLRLLLTHARVEMKLITTDPTRDIDRAKERNQGFRTWEEEHIARFRAHHPSGTVPRLALELLLNAGQRRGDTVKLGRQHVTGQALRIRQGKTGQWVEVPILPDLAAELQHVPTGQMTFLEVSGRARTPGGFYNSFIGWCEDAGIEAGLSPHGLRKACGTRLADAGCTAHQIMAVLGHRTLSEAQKYCEAADRKRNAQEAMEKVLRFTSRAKPERG